MNIWEGRYDLHCIGSGEIGKMISVFLRSSDVVAAKILEVLEALLAVLSMLLMLLRIHPVVLNEVQDVSGRGRGEHRRLRMVVAWKHCCLEVGGLV